MGISGLSYGQINIFQAKGKYSGAQSLNCFSQMPRTTQQAKVNFVKKWSAFISKAAFTIPLHNIDAHMQSIHGCFSKDGWNEFTNAINRSGNVVLVQSRQYEGTSSIEGSISVVNQAQSTIWETKTPLLVIYSNKESRINQRLTIHLRLQQEYDGQLRITQIVGIPREASQTAMPQ